MASRSWHRLQEASDNNRLPSLNSQRTCDPDFEYVCGEVGQVSGAYLEPLLKPQVTAEGICEKLKWHLSFP